MRDRREAVVLEAVREELSLCNYDGRLLKKMKTEADGVSALQKNRGKKDIDCLLPVNERIWWG